MKNVPIKFRGVAYITNKVIFGDLIHYSGCPFIRTSEFNQCLNKAEYAVEPDSVAQLVCYDINGNEVYEGDVLVSEDEFDYDEGKAVLVPTWTHGYIELDKDTVEDYELRLKKD